MREQAHAHDAYQHGSHQPGPMHRWSALAL